MKNILIIILSVCSMAAFAQEQRIKEEGKVTFTSHWFMQTQAGVAQTIGETKFADLISPTVAVNIGYKFTPAFAARIGASGWQSKGGWVSPKQDYQYKYLQGNVDMVADLSTLFCGFNPARVFNGYLFAGVGVNHAFDNDEANALDTKGYEMEYLWKGSKNFAVGRLGLGCDLRLNDRIAFNIEMNANVLSDKYNSKKAGNCDWQLNALIGLSFKLGKGYTKKAPIYYEEVRTEQPKPAPTVEQPQPKQEVEVVKSMKQDIYFTINSTRILDNQQAKIAELIAYLEKYPNAKVTIIGYADANTGTPEINSKLSENRAKSVEEALKAKGIVTSRITTDFKGDTVQPYATPEENRVSVCIAE